MVQPERIFGYGNKIPVDDADRRMKIDVNEEHKR